MLTCAGSLPIGAPASPAGARIQLTASAAPPIARTQRNRFIHRSGRFSALRSSCVLMHLTLAEDGAMPVRRMRVPLTHKPQLQRRQEIRATGRVCASSAARAG